MRHVGTSRLADLVIEAYPDPDPCVSLEEFARTRNDDLPGLTLEDLNRERGAARLRWIYDPNPSPWFLERISALDRELNRRRRGR